MHILPIDRAADFELAAVSALQAVRAIADILENASENGVALLDGTVEGLGHALMAIVRKPLAIIEVGSCMDEEAEAEAA